MTGGGNVSTSASASTIGCLSAPRDTADFLSDMLRSLQKRYEKGTFHAAAVSVSVSAGQPPEMQLIEWLWEGIRTVLGLLWIWPTNGWAACLVASTQSDDVGESPPLLWTILAVYDSLLPVVLSSNTSGNGSGGVGGGGDNDDNDDAPVRLLQRNVKLMKLDMLQILYRVLEQVYVGFDGDSAGDTTSMSTPTPTPPPQQPQVQQPQQSSSRSCSCPCSVRSTRSPTTTPTA